MTAMAMPAEVALTGVQSARELDVRPILGAGGDPFKLIVKTVKALRSDEALHLIVGFEPKPLYTVMRMFGRRAHVEQADGVFHVWFYKPGKGAPQPEQAPAAAPAAPESADAPLQEPVELDVRGLEPPMPMIAVLEKLVELGPGAQLMVRHHREPVLLYEKLKLRGYGARAHKHAEGEWVIHVAPARVFEEG